MIHVGLTLGPAWRMVTCHLMWQVHVMIAHTMTGGYSAPLANDLVADT
jgi:hypothetical protein